MCANEYRTFGALYVILGSGLFLYFSASFFNAHVLSDFLDIAYYWPRSLRVGFSLVTEYGSLVLGVLGLILVVRGVKWIFWISSVLCVFLLLCYFFILFYPLMIQA